MDRHTMQKRMHTAKENCSAVQKCCHVYTCHCCFCCLRCHVYTRHVCTCHVCTPSGAWDLSGRHSYYTILILWRFSLNCPEEFRTSPRVWNNFSTTVRSIQQPSSEDTCHPSWAFSIRQQRTFNSRPEHSPAEKKWRKYITKFMINKSDIISLRFVRLS